MVAKELQPVLKAILLDADKAFCGGNMPSAADIPVGVARLDLSFGAMRGIANVPGERHVAPERDVQARASGVAGCEAQGGLTSEGG